MFRVLKPVEAATRTLIIAILEHTDRHRPCVLQGYLPIRTPPPPQDPPRTLGIGLR